MNRTAYLILGLSLFALFVLQDVMGWDWVYLETLQQDQMYRRWSGLGLSVVILFQWLLTLVRSVEKWEELSMTFYNIHNWLGALSPLLFYVHSTQLGFAYLFLLSVTFFGNFILGMFNLDVIKQKAMWIFQGWMILHVSFSFFITFLTLFHVWIVFYYE